MIFPEQARAPVLFVMVQPVEPDPPAKLTSPVEVPAIFTAPEPFASIARVELVVEVDMVGVAFDNTKVEPVRVPAEVIVPDPDVEMLPLVVMASPDVAGESVVPLLCQ